MRKVLITGANRGLGLKLSEVLSPKYHIYLTARDLAKAEAAKRALLQSIPGAQIEAQQLDISKFDSIKDYASWVQSSGTVFDVIVNNGGINENISCDRLAFTIMNTNLFGLINLTETLLPKLSSDGKIILISSMLGKTKIQPQSIREALNQPLSKAEILKLARELIEVHEATGKYGKWSAHLNPLYKASKALVNAYGRYVLGPSVGPNQSVYMVHPGWVKTDMGGQNAPGSIEDGVVTSRYLIDEVPFGRNAEFHGKYFNDKCKVEEF